MSIAVGPRSIDAGDHCSTHSPLELTTHSAHARSPAPSTARIASVATRKTRHTAIARRTTPNRCTLTRMPGAGHARILPRPLIGADSRSLRVAEGSQSLLALGIQEVRWRRGKRGAGAVELGALPAAVLLEAAACRVCRGSTLGRLRRRTLARIVHEVDDRE